jgi:hypothetical protein
VKLYARLSTFLGLRASRKPSPDYAWSGCHPLTKIATHYLDISSSAGGESRADPLATAHKIQQFFIPDGDMLEWSDERRSRVDLWKQLLTPPYTHLLCFSYQISATGEFRPILKIDLNLSSLSYSPSQAARKLGVYLVYVFERVDNRWLLYRGDPTELFWLMAIERKYADLREAIQNPNDLMAVFRQNHGKT